MHAHVIANMDQFVHKNTGLQEYLERLIEHEKELFIITNSPFPFLWVKVFEKKFNILFLVDKWGF